MKFWKDIVHNIRVHGHTIWLCARDPDLAWPIRIFAFIIAAYAVSPIDLIPDFIPVLGLLDDALLLPAGIWILRKLIRQEIYARNRSTAMRASEQPVSRLAALFIVSLWILLVAGLAIKLGLAHYL